MPGSWGLDLQFFRYVPMLFTLLLFFPSFFSLAMSCSMWDISFIVRSQTCGPCIWSMESWTLDCLPCSLLSPPFPLFSISLLPSKQGTQFCVCECLVTQSCPNLCDPMDCSLPGSSVHGDSPGKNTGMGFLALLQGIFPTQGSNPGLLHCRQILYWLSQQGSPTLVKPNLLQHLHHLLHVALPNWRFSQVSLITPAALVTSLLTFTERSV